MKGTPINGFPSLEAFDPGQWDDTVLERLDDFMVMAHSYGIKLWISIHSYNTLSSNPPGDFYGSFYGTSSFYTNENAITAFKNRIKHVLSHINPHNGKPWGQSSEYILAFEAQNEAMHNQASESICS